MNCVVLGKIAISLTTIASDRDDLALVESGAQSILSEITLCPINQFGDVIDAYDNATWDKVVEYGTKVTRPTTDIEDALARAKVVKEVLDCMCVL
jgi:hypothetical protein